MATDDGFDDRWNEAMTDMHGTEDPPPPGPKKKGKRKKGKAKGNVAAMASVFGGTTLNEPKPPTKKKGKRSKKKKKPQPEPEPSNNPPPESPRSILKDDDSTSDIPPSLTFIDQPSDDTSSHPNLETGNSADGDILDLLRDDSEPVEPDDDDIQPQNPSLLSVDLAATIAEEQKNSPKREKPPPSVSLLGLSDGLFDESGIDDDEVDDEPEPEPDEYDGYDRPSVGGGGSEMLSEDTPEAAALLLEWMKENDVYNDLLFENLWQMGVKTPDDLSFLLENEVNEIMTDIRVERSHVSSQRGRERLERILMRFDKLWRSVANIPSVTAMDENLDFDGRREIEREAQEQHRELTDLRKFMRDNHCFHIDLLQILTEKDIRRPDDISTINEAEFNEIRRQLRVVRSNDRNDQRSKNALERLITRFEKLWRKEAGIPKRINSDGIPTTPKSDRPPSIMSPKVLPPGVTPSPEPPSATLSPNSAGRGFSFSSRARSPSRSSSIGRSRSRSRGRSRGQSMSSLLGDIDVSSATELKKFLKKSGIFHMDFLKILVSKDITQVDDISTIPTSEYNDIIRMLKVSRRDDRADTRSQRTLENMISKFEKIWRKESGIQNRVNASQIPQTPKSSRRARTASMDSDVSTDSASTYAWAAKGVSRTRTVSDPYGDLKSFMKKKEIFHRDLFDIMIGKNICVGDDISTIPENEYNEIIRMLRVTRRADRNDQRSNAALERLIGRFTSVWRDETGIRKGVNSDGVPVTPKTYRIATTSLTNVGNPFGNRVPDDTGSVRSSSLSGDTMASIMGREARDLREWMRASKVWEKTLFELLFQQGCRSRDDIGVLTQREFDTIVRQARVERMSMLKDTTSRDRLDTLLTNFEKLYRQTKAANEALEAVIGQNLMDGTPEDDAVY